MKKETNQQAKSKAQVSKEGVLITSKDSQRRAETSEPTVKRVIVPRELKVQTDVSALKATYRKVKSELDTTKRENGKLSAEIRRMKGEVLSKEKALATAKLVISKSKEGAKRSEEQLKKRIQVLEAQVRKVSADAKRADAKAKRLEVAANSKARDKSSDISWTRVDLKLRKSKDTQKILATKRVSKHQSSHPELVSQVSKLKQRLTDLKQEVKSTELALEKKGVTIGSDASNPRYAQRRKELQSGLKKIGVISSDQGQSASLSGSKSRSSRYPSKPK